MAPYDYIEDDNATHPDDPPLLHVTVVQYNKWRFDASNGDIRLSHGTHTSELLGRRGGGDPERVDIDSGVQVEGREGELKRGLKFEWDSNE